MIKELEKALDAALLRESFRKKGRSWYFDGQDCVCVVNLQASKWSRTLYINLGVGIKSLGAEGYPPVHKCHLYGRIDDLVKNQSTLSHALDAEDRSEPAVTKIGTIIRILHEEALPALRAMSSLRGLNRYLKANRSLNWLMLPEVAAVLKKK